MHSMSELQAIYSESRYRKHKRTKNSGGPCELHGMKSAHTHLQVQPCKGEMLVLPVPKVSQPTSQPYVNVIRATEGAVDLILIPISWEVLHLETDTMEQLRKPA